jgi:peptidoglycan/LPS O-acetylase OafA/YrhL
MTSLSLLQYWTDPGTFKFAGHAAFLPVPLSLPGVFQDRPNAALNGSLWTLKYEVACYVISFGYARFGSGKTAILAVLWLASFVVSQLMTGQPHSGLLYHVERLAFLFQFYGAGMLMYAFRDRIVVRMDWAMAAAGVVIVSPLIGLFVPAVATLGAYALIVAAHTAPRRFGAVTARGDISYGVYLYAFPIQQLLVPLSLDTPVPWLTNIALALPLTIIAGIASWLLVERHFLRARQDRTAEAHAF